MTIGLGCMRLSTDAARDPERGVAVITAAIEAGIALLDTADVTAQRRARCCPADEHNAAATGRFLAYRSRLRAACAPASDRTGRAPVEHSAILGHVRICSADPRFRPDRRKRSGSCDRGSVTDMRLPAARCRGRRRGRTRRPHG